jgi:hypothetical protein
MDYDRLLSFASVHHAIRAERLLTAVGIRVMPLPTPREIDISCGQCLLFYATDQDRALSLLAGEDVRWAKLFSRDAAHRMYEKMAEYEG